MDVAPVLSKCQLLALLSWEGSGVWSGEGFVCGGWCGGGWENGSDLQVPRGASSEEPGRLWFNLSEERD